jgi:hypothetical protein
MARVHAPSTLSAIDWDGNPATSTAGQDVNFDGAPSPALYGFDDWASILTQREARPKGRQVPGRGLRRLRLGRFRRFGSGDFTITAWRLLILAGRLH